MIPKYCIAHPHCARHLCHLRAHERACLQNLRDFPQTKLNSKVNAPLLVNEHGDLYFLLHKNIVYIILFN